MQHSNNTRFPAGPPVTLDQNNKEDNAMRFTDHALGLGPLIGALAIALATVGCSTPQAPSKADAVMEAPRAVPASAERPSTATLYDRLGGYDAISAVVDIFAQKLFDDPVVGKRFFGMGADTRESFRQKNKNLVCNVTGGPCKVTSRAANVVHGGLGIKASEFNIVVGHLVSTLEGFNVPEAEQEELLAIIGTLRPSIVEVEDLEG